MVGQIYNREVANFPIQNARRQRSSGDIYMFLAGTALVFMIMMGYIYVPNQLRQVNIQIEQAKKTIQQLEQEQEFMRMKESELTSPARLEAEAVRLGLQPLEVGQIRYIRSVDVAPTYLAMKTTRSIFKRGSNRP